MFHSNLAGLKKDLQNKFGENRFRAAKASKPQGNIHLGLCLHVKVYLLLRYNRHYNNHLIAGFGRKKSI